MRGACAKARGHPQCQSGILSETWYFVVFTLVFRALPSSASHLILAGMTEEDNHTWLILGSRVQARWVVGQSSQPTVCVMGSIQRVSYIVQT